MRTAGCRALGTGPMQWVAVPRRRRRTTPLAWPPAVPRRAQRGRLGVGGRPIQRERFVARWRRRATVVASRPGHPNPGLCESPYRLSGGTRCVPLLSSPPCGPRAVPRLDAREQPRQRGSLPPGGCAVWPRARLRRRRLSSLVLPRPRAVWRVRLGVHLPDVLPKAPMPIRRLLRLRILASTSAHRWSGPNRVGVRRPCRAGLRPAKGLP